MATVLPETAELGRASETGRAVRAAKEAQRRWAAISTPERTLILRRFRRWFTANLDRATEAAQSPWRRSRVETLAAEALPLLDACQYLERHAARLLRPSRPRGRKPFWLGPLRIEVRREPFGAVLILAPANYPLFLPAVQTLQALAAGNAVLWKPGRFAVEPAHLVSEGLHAAGLPENLLQILPPDAAAGRSAIDEGVDKAVLTGSVESGRAVLRLAAERLIPCTMELSGADAMFVSPRADLGLVARALRFGLTWNRGATCIAPRRVFADPDQAANLTKRLQEQTWPDETIELEPRAEERLRAWIADALRRGARALGPAWRPGRPFPATALVDVPRDADILQHDPFAPIVSIVPVRDMEEALEADRDCAYALGATVFGEEREARALAGRIDAGLVVINDLIAPSADPRIPFGGRGASGFGVTRGAEGLLEMTRPKAVVTRRSRFLPHLEPSRAGDEDLFAGYARAVHGGGWLERWRGLRLLAAALRSRTKGRKTDG